MFEPKLTYSDKLVSQLIKLENLKTGLIDLDLSYNVRHKLSMNAKTMDLFHLAHSLGQEISIKDAEKIASGIKLESLSDQKGAILVNFRNALEFSRSNIADTYAELDFTILLHLNKLILTSWRESWDARFRNVSDQIEETEDSILSLRDTSIDPETIQQEMISLVEWYKNVTPTMAPVVRIAVVFYRLLEAAPFYSGNKYTILALIDYLLLKNNFSSKAYSSFIRSFDNGYDNFIESYNLSKKNFDLTFWLENFVTSLIKELTQVRESINEFIVEEDKSKQQPFLDLNKRQLKILRYLQTVPIIKREDYCHMMEVSTMTAFRDLNDLVRKKLIKVEGQGRGTKYRLASM